MDPLLELLRRGRLLHPEDHSLEGQPLTFLAVAVFVVFGIALALRLNGRSWRMWFTPASLTLYVFWGGLMIGQHGFTSGLGIVWSFGLVLVLGGAALRTFRAALRPSKGLRP